jgi:lipopolysaccharide transport system permease protein
MASSDLEPGVPAPATGAGARDGGPAAAQSEETLIQPSSGWVLPDLRELWRYRELLYFLALRDVKVRYKQTVLGAAWAVFQPALMMTVFWLFLGGLAQAGAGPVPYPLFVFTGLLPWFLFATTVTGAANSLLDSERLIAKVYFPRLLIPFGAAGPGLIDFAVGLTALVGLMAANGVAPAPSVLLLPVALGLVLVTALGAGALLAALNVAYRDFRYVVPFLIQAWLFATPSIYLVDRPAGPPNLPAAAGWALRANPMTGLIDFFRSALLGGPLPWAEAGVSAAVGVVLFLAGCLYFRRLEDGFADVI